METLHTWPKGGEKSIFHILIYTIIHDSKIAVCYDRIFVIYLSDTTQNVKKKIITEPFK